MAIAGIATKIDTIGATTIAATNIIAAAIGVIQTTAEETISAIATSAEGGDAAIVIVIVSGTEIAIAMNGATEAAPTGKPQMNLGVVTPRQDYAV